MIVSKDVESRDRFEVEHEFIAYRDQDEGYGLDSCPMKIGVTVWADLEFWKGKVWEGFEVVKFYCELSRFCVERSTFINSTKKEKTPK